MFNFKKYTYFYFILILFSPILSFFTFKNFLISSQYYMGVILSLLGIILLLSNKKIIIPKYAWLLLIYIFYRLIWSFNTNEFEERTYRVILKNQFIHTFFGILVIENISLSTIYIKKTLKIIKYTVIIAATTSVIQVINPTFLDSTYLWLSDPSFSFQIDIYEFRRMSIFGYIDMNEIGLSYIPLLSVLIGVFLLYRQKSIYFFMLLGGLSAFLTNTRYIMIAFIIISFQVIISQKNKIFGIIKYLFIALFVGIFLVQFFHLLGYNFEEWFNRRLLAEGSLKETTRYKGWINFLYFFPKNLYFGTGGMTEAIKNASISIGSSQIHVGYLSHLVYFGLVGSFILFSFWYLLAKSLYTTAVKTKYWGSFYAFITFLWANFTLVTFHLFFYGLLIALLFDKYFRDFKNLNNVDYEKKLTKGINYR